MNFKKIIIYIFILQFLSSCANIKIDNQIKEKEKTYFYSKGFALIYEDGFYDDGIINKKINNNDIVVMHSTLKRNTLVKIVNPENSMFTNVKILKTANYPKIFNLVISKKLATTLELDLENPYIEVREIKKNKTFIAKESNTFEEESKVAGKAPVEKIKMDVLTDTKNLKNKKTAKKNNFILIISDFYYLKSANSLKQELSKKTGVNKFSVIKIKENQYRLSIGSFENFNALKSIYISLNNLGFDDLSITNEKK